MQDRSENLYYFHGDRTPEGLYYCRRCDSFESRNHFVAATEKAGGAHLDDTNSFEVHMQKYKQMKRMGVPSGYHRPKDADQHNIVL